MYKLPSCFPRFACTWYCQSGLVSHSARDKWHLITLSSCISLMTNDGNHFFRWPLAIFPCVYFSCEVPAQVFCELKALCCLFVIELQESLSVWDRSLVWCTCGNISSQLAVCLFPCSHTSSCALMSVDKAMNSQAQGCCVFTPTHSSISAPTELPPPQLHKVLCSHLTSASLTRIWLGSSELSFHLDPDLGGFHVHLCIVQLHQELCKVSVARAPHPRQWVPSVSGGVLIHHLFSHAVAWPASAYVPMGWLSQSLWPLRLPLGNFCPLPFHFLARNSYFSL